MRQFNIINEKGERYSLMDINNYCFATDPTGLGLSYKNSYAQVGNSFIQDNSQISQQKPTMNLNFKNYTNFNNFINFVTLSKSLKLEYGIEINGVSKIYYREFNFENITKSEKQNCYIVSKTTITTTSLWYESKEVVYTISKETNEITWDFDWDSKFSGYGVRNLIFENKGHVDAPFLLEIDGGVEHPKIQILDGNNNIINELKLSNLVLETNEKLLLCTKDTDMYIYHQKTNEMINLFNSLDINKTNFFKLPLGLSQIRLSGDSDITNAKLTIYMQYIAV